MELRLRRLALFCVFAGTTARTILAAELSKTGTDGCPELYLQIGALLARAKTFGQELYNTGGLRLLAKKVNESEESLSLLEGFFPKNQALEKGSWFTEPLHSLSKGIQTGVTKAVTGHEPAHYVRFFRGSDNATGDIPLRLLTGKFLGTQYKFAEVPNLVRGAASGILVWKGVTHWLLDPPTNALMRSKVEEQIFDAAPVLDERIQNDFRFNDVKIFDEINRPKIPSTDTKTLEKFRQAVLGQAELKFVGLQYFAEQTNSDSKFLDKLLAVAQNEKALTQKYKNLKPQDIDALSGIERNEYVYWTIAQTVFKAPLELYTKGYPSNAELEAHGYAHPLEMPTRLSDKKFQRLVNETLRLHRKYRVIRELTTTPLTTLEVSAQELELEALRDEVEASPFTDYLLMLYSENKLTKDQLRYRLEEDAYWQTQKNIDEIVELTPLTKRDGKYTKSPRRVEDIQEATKREIDADWAKRKTEP